MESLSSDKYMKMFSYIIQSYCSGMLHKISSDSLQNAVTAVCIQSEDNQNVKISINTEKENENIGTNLCPKIHGKHGR